MKKICTGHYYIGYRQAMSREGAGTVSATGLLYILAVSGFHVAIVCPAFIFSFLFSPGMDVAGGFATSFAACANVGSLLR